MAPRKKQPPARVHPDDRSRTNALNEMATLFHGVPETKPELSYYSPILIQCTLPHSDPKTASWARKNGNAALVISSGFDKDGNMIGVPYGSFPRLVLAYIITRVLHTGDGTIQLESHFGKFLKEIGYLGNLRGSTRASRTIQNQMHRLMRATINFEGSEVTADQGEIVGANIQIAKRYGLWWNYKNPEQGSLWGSFIQISEEFRLEILKAPVPLRTDILSSLKKSPLALDVYMWISYRLFAMQTNGHEQVSLSYGRLQAQFGTGIAESNYRQFRKELKLAFNKVAEHWRSPDGKKQALHYEFHEDRLTLYRSPLLVAKTGLKSAQLAEERTAILSRRSFDIETQRKARQLAGGWNVDYLSQQYFAWIEREGITPENPRAHFFDFIKTHRQRNPDPEQASTSFTPPKKKIST